MENAMLLTVDDIDMIAEAIAFYCVAWYFGARIVWDLLSFALSRFFGREE
ncbi:hypothetical protein [Vibrio diazotrophicus]|nr:hypothetical protein [Vibrio diazotrophicus]